MKCAALGLVVVLLFTCVSYAQQSSAADAPASKEDIQRYLDAMHTREMMKGMMETLTKQMQKMTHEMVQKQANLPADFEARENATIGDMFKNFPVDEMIDAMIPVYQKHLTKGDVDGLVAFYTSPTGQKMIKELPAMTAESMQASSGIVQKMMAQAVQRVQDDVAQMEKSNDGSSSKTPASTPN
jgi:hypothetical protein